MVELLIVVGLIVVMAAVALPNIAGFVRQSRVRGAMQQVAGEIQTARNQAVIKNTNRGVAFEILDADTYRFLMIADDGIGILGRGPLRQLPAGVTFVPAADFGIGFDRLGRACAYAAPGPPGCIVNAPRGVAALCTTPGEVRECTNNTPGPYLQFDAAGTITVTVRENTTQLTRWVSVAPGGRVQTQR
jgi:type II secretory pathway pseudopilin PulG